ncbi:MAG: hypothetical protein LBC12_01615 [Nitrososphaerota archaeon]|jgi:hypothetical protein|nr:hypothetical protein [Nitrososphaerota archaeon]
MAIFVNQWVAKSVRVSDSLVEAIKKALRNPEFVLFVRDALGDDKAVLYGLEYNHGDAIIQFTKQGTLNRKINHIYK